MTQQANVFIPYRRISFDSALAPEVLGRRLRELKDAWNFSGNIWSDGFRLSERFSRKRIGEMYRPWVDGSITAGSQGGSRVVAIMSLHPIELAFICAILLAVSLSMIGYWASGWPFIVALAAGHVAGCTLAFTPSARRAEELLRAAGKAG